jgi:hypothetical protein
VGHPHRREHFVAPKKGGLSTILHAKKAGPCHFYHAKKARPDQGRFRRVARGYFYQFLTPKKSRVARRVLYNLVHLKKARFQRFPQVKKGPPQQ